MTEIFTKAEKFTEAAQFKKMGLYPYFVPSTTVIGPRTVMDGKETIMLGSNNYMGMNNHPEVKKAAIEAIEKYGTGCTGSRLLNGTIDLHEELEANLAKFIGKDATLTFTTGYQTNLGVISSMAHRGDFLISDSKNHASIVDACKLSRAEKVIFNHNDMADLEKVLKDLPKDSGKMIVTDGVFSMEGDLAKMKELVELKEQYSARLLIDDAHGVGYLGSHGEGVGGHFKCMKDIDLLVGTFSKSFASVGGFAAGNEEVIDFMKHHARSFIFSASCPPASVATVIKSMELIEKGDDLRANLMKNAKHLRDGLTKIGYETGYSETPIVPVILHDPVVTFKTWRVLLDNGVYTNPVRAPAVDPGHELLRTSLMATHNDKDVDDAIVIFEKVGKMLKLI